MKKTSLSKEEMKKITGGDVARHGEKCKTHNNCPPGHVCVRTSLDSICCTSDDLHGTGPNPHPGCLM